MSEPSQPDTSATVKIDHNGLRISVSVTGPNAIEDVEKLLDKAFDYVDEDETDAD